MSIKDSIIDALKEEHMKRRWRVEQIAPAQAHASGHRSVSPNDSFFLEYLRKDITTTK